jgi:CRISPR-associated endonuclease Cas1
VLTLFGYGVSVRLDRGHLALEDGIGPHRRFARLPRIGHGLRRLVLIGSDGLISLAAIRWLADQKASLIMLNRNGTVLVSTGPIGPRDARLRRAQALAPQSNLAMKIARDLIAKKLVGQERNIRELLNDADSADSIAVVRERLSAASTISDMRLLESQAALAYWSCWRSLPVTFPKVELFRVPQHWRVFGARISPLTNSPRLSVNPPNAILNYLYAVLESEARLAASALGLDPGLGVMHVDTNVRDSLACDLMEPVRPLVDAYVLKWLRTQSFKREWFFEERTGTCRLMGRFVERLSETASTWAQAVAPIAEGVAKQLWATTSVRRGAGVTRRDRATRLTQQHRRDAKGVPLRPLQMPQAPPRVCCTCGKGIQRGTYCVTCSAEMRPERMVAIAAKGRLSAHSVAARRKNSMQHKRLGAALRAWNSNDHPHWLTEQVYTDQLLPRLKGVSAAKVASALGVSQGYVFNVRAGKYRLHPRHWSTVASLVGVSEAQCRTKI